MTFDDFWAVYPRRQGGNPKHPASLKFANAVKNGADPAHIVSSAKRYAEEQRAQKTEGTPYVCMAVTWLNQKRWMDYAPELPPTSQPETSFKCFIKRDTPEWDKWQAWLKANGKPTGSPYSPRDNGWWFPSQLPPGLQLEER